MSEQIEKNDDHVKDVAFNPRSTINDQDIALPDTLQEFCERFSASVVCQLPGKSIHTDVTSVHDIKASALHNFVQVQIVLQHLIKIAVNCYSYS